MEQEYAIAWVTLALLNAGLARCMNRDGFWWFSLSTFAGPTATFFLVMLGPVAPKTVTETKERRRNRGDEGFPL